MGLNIKKERLNQTKITFICNVLIKVVKIEDEQQSLRIYILEIEDNIKKTTKKKYSITTERKVSNKYNI